MQFEPSFIADVLHGGDYLTADPFDGITRPNLIATVVPRDGSTPFQMQATGVQFPDPRVGAIVASNVSTGAPIPYGAVYSGEF
jgi:hypothetical protein